MNITGLHTCFYEGWCTERYVEEVVRGIEELVIEVGKGIGYDVGSSQPIK